MIELTEDWRAIGAEGIRLLSAGRPREAALMFGRVVSLRPDDADGWFNLGYAQRQARQYVAALQSYDEALARGARRPEEIRLNRAVILSEHLHRSEEAEAELQKAVEQNPRCAGAWLNLGNLYEDLGNASAARNAYRSVLGADPSNGRAVARLAAIAVHDGDIDGALADLRAATTQHRAISEDAAEVRFALANTLDAAGQYRPAFAELIEANRLALALQPRQARYEPATMERVVDQLIETFPLPVASAQADAGGDNLFICGMFRSGSTLSEQMLARHPAIEPCGELEFLPALVAEDLQPYPSSLSGTSSDRLQRLGETYGSQARTLFPTAQILADKRPDNFLHLGLIRAILPSAKMIQTVRNPLDNILSVFFLYFGDAVAYSNSLDTIVHYYRQYRRLMDHWELLFGQDLHRLSYDELVAAPDATLGRAFDHLGLDPLADLSGGDPAPQIVRTASNWQVRSPVHRRSSGRWLNYADELSDIRRALVDAGIVAD